MWREFGGCAVRLEPVGGCAVRFGRYRRFMPKSVQIWRQKSDDFFLLLFFADLTIGNSYLQKNVIIKKMLSCLG